MQSLTILNAVV